MNDVKETPYLINSISTYLFIFALEVVFTLINANPNIELLEFFTHNFSYPAYPDDTTSFLRNKNSALKVINTFDTVKV